MTGRRRVARLIVARHGRTSWNAAGRFQGRGDPPLDDVGEAQARALAADLAPLGPAVVASSDLRRARETAAAVASACGLGAGGVVVDPDLAEVDLGSWEGCTREEVALRHPEEYRRWSAGEDVRRGGGETRAEAAQRCTQALLRVAGATPAGRVAVVVAHGMVLQATLDALGAGGLLVAPGLPDGAPHLGNGEWLALDLALVPG